MSAEGLFRLAVTGLGLRPADAWALSVRELLLLAAGPAAPHCGRAQFDALRARYPDRSYS